MGRFLCFFPTKNIRGDWKHLQDDQIHKFKRQCLMRHLPPSSFQRLKCMSVFEKHARENITDEISRMAQSCIKSTCEEKVVFHHIPDILHLRCTNKHAKSLDCHHIIMPTETDATWRFPFTAMLASSGTKLLLPHRLHKLEHSPGLLGKSWQGWTNMCCCHACISLMKEEPSSHFHGRSPCQCGVRFWFNSKWCSWNSQRRSTVQVEPDI